MHTLKGCKGFWIIGLPRWQTKVWHPISNIVVSQSCLRRFHFSLTKEILSKEYIKSDMAVALCHPLTNIINVKPPNLILRLSMETLTFWIFVRTEQTWGLKACIHCDKLQTAPQNDISLYAVHKDKDRFYMVVWEIFECLTFTVFTIKKLGKVKKCLSKKDHRSATSFSVIIVL